jgi:hypothetical protein
VADLRVLHIDLDTGKLVAKGSAQFGGPSNSNFVLKAGDTMTGFLTLHDLPVDPYHAAPKLYVDNAINDVLTQLLDVQSDLQSQLSNFVLKTGDTMTGRLFLANDPFDPAEAATKQYVDQNALLKTGGKMTGYIELNGDPVQPLHPATKQYVDALFTTGGGNTGVFLPLAGGTMQGPLYLSRDPVDETEAATKRYVDSVAQGLDVKESVRAVATTNVSLFGLQTIDGVNLVEGDRVLLVGQTDATENGIYVVSENNWTRAEDANGTTTGPVTSGMYTYVEEGLNNRSTSWVLTTANPITIDITPLTFNKFSGVGNFVKKEGDTMEGPLILSRDPIIEEEAATKRYVDNHRNGYVHTQLTPDTIWLVQHNGNTTNVIVQVFVNNELIIPDNIKITGANTVEVTFRQPVVGVANVLFVRF